MRVLTCSSCPWLVQADFVANFAKVKPDSTTHMHRCHKHKMSDSMGRIMKPGPKPWPSLTEASINTCAAAWSWLHELDAHAHDIKYGQLSKVAQCCTILRCKSADKVYASMGNSVWGALAMPLARVEVNKETFWKWQQAPIEFLHLYNLRDWDVLPFVVTRLRGHGLVMKQLGCVAGKITGVPILVSTLRTPRHLSPHQTQ